jgi:hypothetical protein
MTARRAAVLQPSDTIPFIEMTVAIQVSIDGTYYLKLEKDTAFVAHVLIAGIIYPFRVKQIQNTTLPATAVVTGYYAG